MKKFKILVAVDFSNDSFIVLQKAIDFSKKQGGIVDVVHVVEGSFFLPKKDINSIRKNSFKKLNEKFPQIDKENFHCVKGKIKDTVGTTAKILDSDLIIMGKSGERYFLGDFHMGSHTKDIVRSSPVPVIVVKSEHELEYKNILILTDFSKESAKAIKKVIKLFPNSQIKVLNFYLLPFRNRLNSYGFSDEDIIEYQYALKEESEKKLDAFLNSLQLPTSVKITARVKQSSLNPKLFEEEVEDLVFDLVAIHTTGKVSFYALDVLESSRKDVVMLKI